MDFKKQWGLWLGIIIVIVFSVIAFTSGPRTIEPVLITVPAVSATDHIRGNFSAKNILIGYGDFQCPACAAYEPLLNQLAKEFPDTLAIVFRQFPLRSLHPNANLAAVASEAADKQGKFWEMHDMLYDKQIEWEKSTDVKTIFTSYAVALGLNKDKFVTDMNSDAIKSMIDAEYSADISMGLQGTPTFFINGKQIINNPSSYDALKALIQ